jgi:hypothetical protein
MQQDNELIEWSAPLLSYRSSAIELHIAHYEGAHICHIELVTHNWNPSQLSEVRESVAEPPAERALEVAEVIARRVLHSVQLPEWWQK